MKLVEESIPPLSMRPSLSTTLRSPSNLSQGFHAQPRHLCFARWPIQSWQIMGRVRPEDFFTTPAPGPFGELDRPRFNLDLIRELRSSPIAGVDDTEAAVALARLIHDELETFGTEGGEELTDAGIREAIQALYAVASRLGITDLEIPFRDFKTFRSYWIKQGASGAGGWQARRDILGSIFDSLHDTLAQREAETLQSTLASAVSPRGRT